MISTAEIAQLMLYILGITGGVIVFSLFAGWVMDAYDEWRNEE